MVIDSVLLSDVLHLNIDAVEINPAETYNMSGVYGFGRGLFHREPLQGSETSYKRFHRLTEGKVVLSQLKGWEGGIAVVDGANDGRFLSTQFPTFTCDETQALISYVGWFLRYPPTWDQLRLKARGMGARRDTISPEKFLSLSMPLPSLNEQQKIVSMLDQMEQRTIEVRSRRSTIRNEVQSLIRALVFGDTSSPHPQLPFGRIARQLKLDTLVEPDSEYQFAGIYSFGRGMFRSEKKLGSEFSYKQLSRVKKNNFVYPKLMAWEGALAVVPDKCDGCFVSPEFPVFEIDQDIIDPVVVDAYFRHPLVWPTLSGTSKGTNVRRRRLHPKAILTHQMPVPPFKVQELIKKLLLQYDPFSQANHGDELEILMPSMLDKFFKGGAEAP